MCGSYLSSMFIHILVNDKTSAVLYVVKIVYIFCVHCSIKGLLGSFCILTTTNNTAISMQARMPLHRDSLLSPGVEALLGFLDYLPVLLALIY